MLNKWHNRSTRWQHSLTFLFLAVCLLLSGLIMTWGTYKTQINQNIELQQEIAEQATDKIDSLVNTLVDDIEQHIHVGNLLNLPLVRQKILLSQIMSHKDSNHDHVFNEISLLDPYGKEIARVSRIANFTADDLRDRSTVPEFVSLTKQEQIFFSPVFSDPLTMESYMIISRAFDNPVNGALAGVITAQVRLKKILDKLTSHPLGKTGYLYISDAKGQIVAHPNPSVVLRGTRTQHLAPPGIHAGLDGTRVIKVSRKLYLSNMVLFVITEKPLSEALAQTYQALQVLVVSLIIFLLLGSFLFMFTTARIVRPIESMASTAKAISAGDFQQRTTITGVTEIAELATAFNSMASQLTTDIARRKQVENELRVSEERYRELVENTGEIIILADADGHFVFTNHIAEKVFGANQDELIGLPIFSFVHPEDHEKTEEWFADCQKQHLVQNRMVSRQINSITGKVSHVLWTANFHYNESGRMNSAYLVAIDITERVQAEQEREFLAEKLLQSQKFEAIGTLAGGIAHDFNNILAIIIGNTELAKVFQNEPAKMEKSLDQILLASDRGRSLIKHILAISRKEERKRAPLHVPKIIDEILSLLRSSLPATIEIIPPSEPNETCIMAEAIQIHQLLINICTNAAQAMDENGGRLEVGIESVEFKENDLDGQKAVLRPGPYVKIAVSDTGEGIPADVLPRIFDPYFTTKEVGKGSGMGLAIAMGIVQNHEGTINVDSMPGKGTTFSLYFPEIDISEPLQKDTAEIAPEGSERVLVVDDDEAVGRVTGKRLETLGYNVTILTDSRQVLERISAQPDEFDIIVTDQTMPSMTGAQLATEILRIRPDLPIILCTGYSTKINQESARELGIKAFLMKPVNNLDLAKNVRKVLDNSQQQA